MTMPELHILDKQDDAVSAAAEFVATLSEECTRGGNRFTIALAGGSTPEPLYNLLASPTYVERVEWDSWNVFWSDERSVPPGDSDSNYRMARNALLDRVPIPSDQVHRIRGENSPQAAAVEYEHAIREVIRVRIPCFDLLLLGMGHDGHTASLFPETNALREKSRLVAANWVPHLDSYRITFTLPLINAARSIAFLVTDESKAEALSRVLQPGDGGPSLPASLVRPASGTVHWFLTRAAARRLEEVSV